ncbi:alpha-amylase [Fulvivirgaceae bacterium BMA10]|uniref:Alpha-amylase n=1 Tax=Splendidivirga corallicola TaxID=3051826 RepID=A0ABT8KMD4_9BACT|nr:alpha-amylase [Fulvivirgaceae bacterium BMA10]
MTRKFNIKTAIIASIFLVLSCNPDNAFNDLDTAKQAIKVQDITDHDGSPFSIDKYDASKARFNPGPGGGVMMQGFYWDVPAGGTWWDHVAGKVEDWSNAGIESIWLPPVSKAQGGATSMGYDPTDYFDFGDYNQNGTVETRFGSKSELIALINSAHNENMKVFADIVINHNSGGQLESNQYTGTNTWTDFTNVASGKFLRTQHDFHPNAIKNNDEGVFGGFPDLSHSVANVQDWLWKRADGVGKYYKNVIGFDGWRFDYVKGFGPWVVKEWNNHVGGFSVGELWDGNVDYLNWWANEANSSVFDFACYYKMNDAFDGNNLAILYDDMMWKRNPFKAVTFVTNHDTDEIWNKMLAYAYILTHEGYPTIFYRDYEEWLNKERLNNLIWIHNNKATGTTSILYADNDEYVARRNGYNGNPGLIVYLNNSNNWIERWVPTNWNNTQIKDFTGHSSWYPTTQGGGWVKIQCPPKSYSVWSPNI